MFKKWSADQEAEVIEGNGDKTVKGDAPAGNVTREPSENKDHGAKPASASKKANAILKGSKLVGDINITSDLELSGDVEGSIKSLKDSNIVLKGTCKGNIDTKEGSVYIEGSLEGGSIAAGNEVSVTGKFHGAGIKAVNRIYVNGEFNGRLEANEIEIGPKAVGKGELNYKETISIARGAKVNVQVGQAQPELKVVDKPQEKVDKPQEKKAEVPVPDNGRSKEAK
jgi:cytoskeletal protein CcmA (bactofilin family)